MQRVRTETGLLGDVQAHPPLILGKDSVVALDPLSQFLRPH